MNSRPYVFSHSGAKLLCVVILFACIGRASLLEYTELLDPTEARYATISQSMVVSNQWLTPIIPLPEGPTPYLGKPPLFFWLTALSYRFFGVEEWTSRLVSYLSSLGILFLMYYFVRARRSRETALASLAIVLSSGLFYLSAGASVTDLLLTLLVSASVMYAYRAIKQSSKYLFIVASLFAALSFLVKGPVGVALIVLPVLLWSLVRRYFSWINFVPITYVFLAFLVVVAPWFILSEISNPGFLKYFFWNENIARYLFKDYGDRYGSGHVHPYGTAWLMLFAAFLPHALLWIGLFWKTTRAKFVALFRHDSDFSFMCCWAISTPLLFTFVRQFHVLYLLPALPPLSILTAYAIEDSGLLMPIRWRSFLSRYFPAVLIGVVGSAIVVGAILDFDNTSLVLSLGFLGASYGLSRKFVDYRVAENSSTIGQVAFVSITLYLALLVSLTPFVEEQHSSEGALIEIAHAGPCLTPKGTRIFTVGLSTRNTFSPYWLTRNWRNELPEALDIRYVEPSSSSTDGVCFYLWKRKRGESTPQVLSNEFAFLGTSGVWSLYKNRTLLR